MSDILARMARRVMFAIGRGRVTLVDDTGVVQRHQLDMGPQGPNGSLAIRDKTPALGLFGFSSNPPIGADVIVLFVGGDRSNGVAVATNHQSYRIKNLNPGEVVVHDQWGNVVKLTAAGMTLTHSGKITLTAPIVDIEGVLQVGGVAVTVP